MALLALALILALSRAEMIARLKSPVITQCDGFVRVYANCPPDIRKEFQSPIARFATETVTAIARAEKRNLVHRDHPALVLHLGDVRTNRADVIVRVATNESDVVTKIFIPSPGFADLNALRAEIVRSYRRAFALGDVSREDALEIFRMSDPEYRLYRERQKLADWLYKARGDDRECLGLLYRIQRPGELARSEALVFASRLRLYPSTFDQHFCGRYASLDFRTAIAAARDDVRVRFAAMRKASELPVFGGGRGLGLKTAADAYSAFLTELAKGEKSDDELKDLLENADTKFNQTYEGTK